MSQLENTQTVVLQQEDGKKIYLDLNVSTDTTAIESFKQASLVSEKAFEKSTDISNASFDYATGIAVFLALCATGLAYWFGRKSFKLTEMSFKTVVEEIKASQQSAKDLNTRLFEQQKELQKNELQYAFEASELDKLRTIISEYLTCLIDFNKFITMQVKSLDKEVLIKESVKYNLRVANYTQLIELFLDCENKDLHREVKTKLKDLLNILWDIRKALDNDYDEFEKKIIDFANEFDVVNVVLNNLLAVEIRKLKGE